MGIRLHYAKHYEPEWSGGYFNWEHERFDELVEKEFTNYCNQSDDGSIIEIHRRDISQYVDRLSKLDQTAMHDIFIDMTNEQIKHIMEEILTSEDDYIRMEWF